MKTVLFILVGAVFCSAQPTLGSYDKFYDSTEWTWTLDAYGTAVLKNRSIDSCFIGSNTEPLDYDDGENWTLSKYNRIFGKAHYSIIKVEYNGNLWCITYSNLDDWLNTTQLIVYAPEHCKACQLAAEKIIHKKESSNEKVTRDRGALRPGFM